MIKAGLSASAVPQAPFPQATVPSRRSRFSPRRRGFTLVELLVVIAIIAILASILTVGVYSAITFVNKFAIGTEIAGIQQALTQYKSTYGSYPPCIGVPMAYGDPTQLAYYGRFKRHIDTAFRNHRETLGGGVTAADADAASAYAIGPTQTVTGRATQLRDLDPSEALPFFLGGASQFSNNVIGLKQDPIRPLTGAATSTPVSLYTFNAAQLVDLDGDGLPSYIPKSPDGTTPFVYLDGASYKGAVLNDVRLPALVWPPLPEGSASYQSWIDGTLTVAAGEAGYDPGLVRPYINGALTPPVYYEPDGYQLLSAGLDNRYGSDGFHEGVADTVYPKPFADPTTPDPADFKFLAPAGDAEAWLNMSPDDEDNVANFTEGSSFGDIGME